MIRKYTNKDKAGVIELFRLNCPNYFDPTEEQEYVSYLENELEDYFVYEEDSKIIGAGGINYLTNKNKARISWDMIHPQSQGNGIGRKLVQYRVDLLNANLAIEFIEVRTSQIVYKFYQKMGFELQRVEKDFWAKNFDLYQMQMTNKVNTKKK